MSTTVDVGRHLVAGERRDDAGGWFTSVDPRTGDDLEPGFPEATPAVVEEACAAAEEAFAGFSADQPARAVLLRAIAGELDANGPEVVASADQETGLGEGRLSGELARTSGQLRRFADLIEEGSYVGATIDHPDPDTTPPTPDLRRMVGPLGPVAVFGASNFPLAFSVAGGDTASALAAGCPVVAKAHPAHPATSQLVGEIITEAVAALHLPAGTFSLVHGAEAAAGCALVDDPRIRAVGFTGSFAAGRSLFDRAAARDEPIPVFAEMGSLNPVVVGPDAAEARSSAIAEGFVGSMTLGVGQFCTKPGLLFVPEGQPGDDLVDAVASAIDATSPGVLLTPGIRDACAARTTASAQRPGVAKLARGRADGPGIRTDVVLLGTDTATLRGDRGLLEEHFGPTAIVVRYTDPQDAAATLAAMPGSLTGTAHLEATEFEMMEPVLATLRARAGRLVFDGFPTGVAVAPAMQHGGPYPATTDPRFTSVGMAAIERWLRPVVYQDAPPDVLPPALADGNPLRIWRLVDGDRTRN